VCKNKYTFLERPLLLPREPVQARRRCGRPSLITAARAAVVQRDLVLLLHAWVSELHGNYHLEHHRFSDGDDTITLSTYVEAWAGEQGADGHQLRERASAATSGGCTCQPSLKLMIMVVPKARECAFY
jgi:hypothetical protein